MYLGLWWLSGRFDRQGEITSDPLFYVPRRAICPGMSVASTSLPVFRRRYMGLDLVAPLDMLYFYLEVEQSLTNRGRNACVRL